MIQALTAAGLFASLIAAREGARVTLVSARPLAETASYWAQGGLAAALAEDDSPELHVGAYTPQVPTIDMVVNTAWADDIEMATDNDAQLTGRAPWRPLVSSHAFARHAGSR